MLQYLTACGGQNEGTHIGVVCDQVLVGDTAVVGLANISHDSKPAQAHIRIKEADSACCTS